MILFAFEADGMLIDLDCHAAPGGKDCAALRVEALDGTREVEAGPARLLLTGRGREECEASGASTSVATFRQVSGPANHAIGVVTYPGGAVTDYVEYHNPEPVVDGLSREEAFARTMYPPSLAIDDDLATAIAKLGGVESDDLFVEQDIEGNFAGGPALDRLLSIHVAEDGEDEPGYRWSALVLVPDGDRAAMTAVWSSKLESIHVNASYDLDGDGLRTLYWSTSYYEGSGEGVGTIVKGALQIGTSWGCGA